MPLGEAIVTTAGALAARAVIHAVSLDRDRRTSGPVIEAAVRSAMARAREIGATSIAFPALGTGVGGFPLEEAARITVQTVRDELQPLADHRSRHLRAARRGGVRGLRRPRQAAPVDERLRRWRPDELPVRADRRAARRARGEVAREIQLRGLTSSAVHVPGGVSARIAPSAPTRCCSSTRSCAACSAASCAPASEILADETGIELLIARLEELDEEAAWDA